MRRYLGYTIFACLVLCDEGFGTVWFEAADMGVPTNGALVMTGYRGYVIRARSDEGRITRISVGNHNGVLGSIAGGIAQRWEDPTGSGFWGESYIVRSPGPFSANNTFDSDLNFDSHFTFNPASVELETIVSEPYLGTPTATTFEAVVGGQGFITYGSPNAPLGFMPLQSTTTVGYGAALYPYLGSNFSGLFASFRIRESARSDSFEFAYVVSNSAFDVHGMISVDNGMNYGGVFARIIVPEPTSGLIVFSSLIIARRRFRCSSKLSNDVRF
jgi:hypothetical protein